ncbi:FKBP-type peptidyl-prolyl cis-trans isomerase [Methanoregula sp.]|uniref:FKBP-type peptidyl-prolyl cis-trans isomerase n=1 Tax=Methanoregula sp. TaxID=2052170 RepID=UPI003BB13740
MTDPETPGEKTPDKKITEENIPEEKTGSADKITGSPENAADDKGGKPRETTEKIPDNKAAGKQKNLLIAVGVAIIVIIAALCAFVYLTTPVATQGDVVSVYYTGAFDNGTVFDSNMNSTSPFVFRMDNSSVIPGFEEAVTGMSVNQTKTVTVPYAEAYGAYDPTLVQTVNRTGPIANTTFVVGQLYKIHYKTANTYSLIKILNVTPETVTWDANSPLAGQNLTFTITVVGITKP